MRLTAHPTHVLGLVSGERRCLVCYAAPEWDLIEESCASPDLSPEARDAMLTGAPRRVCAPQVTREEMATALRMRGEGATWAAVAVALGRRSSSVQRAVHRYEAGQGRLARRAS